MSETGARSASLRRPVELARAVIRHALAADVPFMAGAIAYQAFVSLLPLLFLLVVVAAALGNAAVTDRLLDIVVGQLPADAQDLVRGAVEKAIANAGSSIVSVVVLGFGAFAVFNGLDKAFTELYGTERGANFPNQIRDAAVVLGVFGTVTILIAATWQSALLPNSLSAGSVLKSVALVLGLTLALYPMFYVFPEVSLGWREVLPGVVVTAVGWTVLQALFRLYVTFVARSDAFGVVSGVLLLATWLYFSGFVLLVGATINAVLHGYGTPESDSSDPDDEAADAPIADERANRH
ncbi:YihY/virulence factor BrkB family protein [Halopelagius fulvigenes]|uniref:YihY/virulence factor BrkB family protein n=1 Tax=Halopelagius fulvigenes TaxID=1198324 RepID=A0ABD5TXU6_9EURY